MKTHILIAAALLTACTTPAERRRQAPDLDLTSNKSAKEVAMCIADKWENTRPTMGLSSIPVSTSMKPNGYSITTTFQNLLGGTNTCTLADVVDIQPGLSSTKYYKISGGGYGDYDEVVKQCQ